MNKTFLIALSATLLPLAGCAATPSPESAGTPADLMNITYETGPCFGTCPVYSVTVSPNGQGVFTGKRFTAASGEQRFTLTREQFARFAEHLAPLRPAQGSIAYSGPDKCPHMITDQPSADITWQGAGGDSQHLDFYFGCDREKYADMAERLRSAPDLLPIGPFIRAEK